MKKSASYTMRDVARLARVSVTTVSTIVNGRPGVSPELTRRVEDAIATLDYHPNEVARSLKVNRTSTIGMVVPDVSNFFFNDVFLGVETKARASGFSVVLCDSHDDPVQERDLLTMLVRRRVDGILLASAQLDLAESRLAGRRPPIVCFDREPVGFKGGVVVIDNVLASLEAARHLIELGHQRIAVIAGSGTTLTGCGRLEGVRKALQEAHIPLPEEYVRPGGFSTEGGYRAALEILQLPTPPSAVLACNNRMTLGLMRALKDLGLKCPQNVSVLGFDEFDWYELFSPRLTTVVQPSYEMGELATEMLLQVIRAQDQHLESHEGNRAVLKAQLRLRDSTAPPASCSGRPQQNSIPLIPRSSAATEPAASQPPEQSSVMEGQIPRLGDASE
jgi:LacI family transcriptional regulator